MSTLAFMPWRKESYALSGGYCLILEVMGVGTDGKYRVSYILRRGKEVVFSGADFSPSPLHCPTGVKSAADCLTLLCALDSDRELTQAQRELCREFEIGYLPMAWAECLGLVEL